MSVDNLVFRKIKEISARGIRPRPVVASLQIASELSLSSDNLLSTLDRLKQMRLVSYCDANASRVRLTLLGSVVRRDK